MVSRRTYAVSAFALALLFILAAPPTYAKIVAHGVAPIQASAGQPVTSYLAYFDTSRDGTKPDEINVVIEWGDGTATPGVVKQGGPNRFWIFGNHTYQGSGEYRVKVKIIDPIQGESTSDRPAGY